MVDPNPGGRGIGHGGHYIERLDALRALTVEVVIGLIGGRDAAHAGAHGYRAALGGNAGKIDLGVSDRLPGGDERQLTHAVEHTKLDGIKM
jgi:hypothetical protein